MKPNKPLSRLLVVLLLLCAMLLAACSTTEQPPADTTGGTGDGAGSGDTGGTGDTDRPGEPDTPGGNLTVMGTDIRFAVNRAELDNATRPLVDRTVEMTKTAVKGAGLGMSSLDRIVMVSPPPATSRMPDR